MRLARIYSRACTGFDAPQVTVEVHLGGGLPRMSIVGLPETAVREARERVKAALENGGYEIPQRLVTISLAPAELPKEGGGFDLPIALGILAASRQIPPTRLTDSEFVGELSLGGDLRPVQGILPAIIQGSRSGRTMVLPVGNRTEASMVRKGEQLCATSLNQVIAWLRDLDQLELAPAQRAVRNLAAPDLADVIGQPQAKRALEIAAAGSHHLLMIGPPGTGKTMLASRLPGILPPISEEEALETAAVKSLSHHGLDHKTWLTRPFRAPHHTCSGIALVGGGARPRPGEISLAHNGVLFLDELTEFQRHALEVLREPLESGRITISRAQAQIEFPARFQLVCAMNPCPCGYAGDARSNCACSAQQIQRYRHKISGPLLDRLDIQLQVSRPEVSILKPQSHREEPSESVHRRVVDARNVQLKRNGHSNALIPARNINQVCALKKREIALLTSVAERFQLSPRACHRIMRVARTIADLETSESIEQPHLAEAIALRQTMITGMNNKRI